ncbi:FtsX-like permease family protein [uncultured Clostridium sp.]|uniref:FtsX-like permease family protein n=1 Tax=uncultured Clostridium sp. TaxID=59620 RepID=UPI0026073BF3|nr:FtsX-like permease family protein [uncultured Clostridium sp.]
MKIIFKNIKGNKVDYGIYLTTMTIGFSIIYIFNSILYNELLDRIIKNFDKANGVFYAALMVVIISMGVFMYYANSFFIKKRKKEFGIFMLLGMGKKKVAKMIFTENIVIGAIATVVGTIAGIILSQFITIAYLDIFNLKSIESMSWINSKALLVTIIVFWIFYLYVSLGSADIVNRYTLLQLFNDSKSSEKLFKEKVVKGIPAVILIILGYLTYPWAIATLGLSVIVTLIIVVKGTYKLFNTKIIEGIKKKKAGNGFEDKVKLVALSNVLFRVRSNARTLSTITILIASTLTTVGICSTLYFSRDSGINNEIAGSIYFVGIFIGIVFTICTLSILLFKLMQEAYEERNRYKILKQIGFTRKDIDKTISTQLKLIYIIPLVIGLIHATVALSITILGLGGKFFVVIGGIYLIYMAIYFVYFVITKILYSYIIFNEN